MSLTGSTGIAAPPYASAGDLTLSNNLTLSNGLNLKRVKKTSAYTTTTSDCIIAVDTSSSAVTITLGSATAVTGMIQVIKDEGGAAGTNNITVATEGSETIDGSATQTISSNYGVLRVYSDGSNFFTF